MISASRVLLVDNDHPDTYHTLDASSLTCGCLLRRSSSSSWAGSTSVSSCLDTCSISGGSHLPRKRGWEDNRWLESVCPRVPGPSSTAACTSYTGYNQTSTTLVKYRYLTIQFGATEAFVFWSISNMKAWTLKTSKAVTEPLKKVLTRWNHSNPNTFLTFVENKVSYYTLTCNLDGSRITNVLIQ